MQQKYQIFEEWPEAREEERLSFSLFTRSVYWQIHLTPKNMYPLCLRLNNDLVAFFCFAIDNNQLHTPFRAPYFEPYLNKDYNTGELLTSLFNYLKLKKFTLNITPNLEFPLNLLLKNNYFKINKVQLAHYLAVHSNTSFAQLFNGPGSERKLRKLKQLSKLPHKVEQIEKHNYMSCYEELLNWRAQKKHINTLPLITFSKLIRQFPKRYIMLQATKGEVALAIAVIVKPKPDNFYAYAVIQNPNYREEANLLLWQAIYELAQQSGVSRIDLGTSMSYDGRINKGLARYKSIIGGVACRKYTFSC